MRRQTLQILIILAMALPLSAEMVVVDARIAPDSPDSSRYLQLVEGAAMEPFFDAGHIVIDAPAADATAFGASAALIVELELVVVDEQLLASAVRYELRTAGGASRRGRLDLESVVRQLSPDERAIFLGTTVADEALLLWTEIKESEL